MALSPQMANRADAASLVSQPGSSSNAAATVFQSLASCALGSAWAVCCMHIDRRAVVCITRASVAVFLLRARLSMPKLRRSSRPRPVRTLYGHPLAQLDPTEQVALELRSRATNPAIDLYPSPMKQSLRCSFRSFLCQLIAASGASSLIRAFLLDQVSLRGTEALRQAGSAAVLSIDIAHYDPKRPGQASLLQKESDRRFMGASIFSGWALDWFRQCGVQYHFIWLDACCTWDKIQATAVYVVEHELLLPGGLLTVTYWTRWKAPRNDPARTPPQPRDIAAILGSCLRSSCGEEWKSVRDIPDGKCRNLVFQRKSLNARE